MNVIEKVFAAAVLVACLLLLARLVLGTRQRARFDAGWRRFSGRIGRLVERRGQRSAEASARSRAERGAAEAIERARRRAEAGAWDGNVYRPKSFGGRKKKRDLH